MQQVESRRKDDRNEIDQDIKKYTLKLKQLIAEKQGLTLEQLEAYRQKEKVLKSFSTSKSSTYNNNNNNNNKRSLGKKIIDVSRFHEIVFKFQCPDCHGYNTKRSGTTTQIETKARFLCYDCQYKRNSTQDFDITPFFVLSNNEMEEQILNSKKVRNEEQRRLFLDKYLIKMKKK